MFNYPIQSYSGAVRIIALSVHWFFCLFIKEQRLVNSVRAVDTQELLNRKRDQTSFVVGPIGTCFFVTIPLNLSPRFSSTIYVLRSSHQLQSLLVVVVAMRPSKQGESASLYTQRTINKETWRLDAVRRRRSVSRWISRPKSMVVDLNIRCLESTANRKETTSTEVWLLIRPS